ncbi:heme exporter protein A [Sphingobium fontiphilum]|uniref:Heme exporter protein A n=1 Tax=Sphingobium fontiphilum TaxID=944425 RepID=A0A7W6DQ16_9SPHN|nr:heme exporter protein A [Sphingobium fontiphilum]
MSERPAPVPSGARLRLADLACLRGGRLLFHHVNLSLAAGEAAMLTGPNGIGKSSLMRVVAGLLPAFAGTVEREGALALTDERLALDMERPMADALAFWAMIDGASPAALAVALDRMALTNLAPVPVRMLSTGQRKRAMLARVIASGAPIWLLDEPANGLDTASIALLGEAIAAHRASGGLVLAASHQPLPMDGAIGIDLRDHAVEPA